MKTELRASIHTTRGGATVFEVWYNGVFIATVTGADGPGIRVISKHRLNTRRNSEGQPALDCIETRIEVS